MYKVKLSKAARFDGKRHERGEKVEVSNELFKELEAVGVVEEAEEIAEVVEAAETAASAPATKGRGAKAAAKEGE